MCSLGWGENKSPCWCTYLHQHGLVTNIALLPVLEKSLIYFRRRFLKLNTFSTFIPEPTTLSQRDEAVGFSFYPLHMLRSFALLLIVTLTGSVRSFSQPATPSEPQVRFDNYKFQTTPPYQQWFRIKGKRTLYGAKADQVILYIRKGSDTICTSFWWKTADSEVDFDLLVDQKLNFGQAYIFDFEFFVDAGKLDVGATLRKDLLARIISKFNSQGFVSDKDVSDEMDDVIEAFKKRFSPGSISFSEKGIKFVEDPQFQTDVAKYGSHARDIAADKRAIKTHEDDSIKYRAALQLELARLNSLQPTLLRLGLTQAQVNALKDIPVSGSMIDANAIDGDIASSVDLLTAMLRLDNELLPLVGPARAPKIAEITAVAPADVATMIGSLQLAAQAPAINAFFSVGTPLPAGDKTALASAVSTLRPIKDLKVALNQYVATRAEDIIGLKAHLKAANAALEADFNVTFDALVTRSAVVRVKQSPEIKIEDEETVRFSPVIGFAFTPLNVNRDIDWRLVGVIGIKYYLQPVDKRVSNPYLAGDRSKWSIMGGVVAGNDLNYKGQVLNNAAFSTKPTIAVGWDWGRLLGINVGALFFLQSHVNSIESGSRLRTSPYVALTIDADLFNRLQSMFAGQKYKIN